MYLFPRVPNARLDQLLATGFDVTNKSILDYGGSRGNLLEDGIERSLINPTNYTSMDVDDYSLNYLLKNYPETNIELYNRYNPVYNPEGKKNLPFPQINNSFDIVFSYSVNTHSSWQDYLFDISEMLRVSRGAIYTSILDLDCLRILHQKRIDEFGSAVDFNVFTNTSNGVYFINHNTVMSLEANIPHNIQYLLTYYKSDWLIAELQKMGMGVRFHKAPSPGIQPLLEIWNN